MIITSDKLQERRERRKFIPRFKMEMGKNFVFIVPKMAIGYDEMGTAYPLPGHYAEEVFKYITGEQVAPTGITEESLDREIESYYEEKVKNGTLSESEADMKMEEYENYKPNSSDIFKLAGEYRQVRLLGRKFKSDVASTSYTDPVTYQRHKDTLEMYADLVGTVYKKLADEKRAQLLSMGYDEEAIKDELRKLYDESPISGIQDKVVIPVVVIECSTTQEPLIQGQVPLRNINYECSVNQFSKFLTKLKNIQDKSHSYMEMNVFYPPKVAQNENIAKMQSAMAMEVNFQPREASVFEMDPTLKKRYEEFRRQMTYSGDVYVKDTFAFKSVSDDEILASAKQWVMDHIDMLTDDEKARHEDLLRRIESTLTPEELQDVVSRNISLSAIDKAMEQGNITSENALENAMKSKGVSLNETLSIDDELLNEDLSLDEDLTL